jgi:hypothetical protein
MTRQQGLTALAVRSARCARATFRQIRARLTSSFTAGVGATGPAMHSALRLRHGRGVLGLVLDVELRITRC